MTNSLVAFALVADEYERSGDPVRGLAPLFRPILRERSGSAYDPTWFADQFTSKYGLAMSPYVAKSISENLASAGLLKEVDRDRFIIATIEELQNDAAQIDERSIREIVGYFERWSKKELHRLGVEDEGIDFEEALLGRLAHPEFASVFLEKGQPRDSERIKRLLGKGDFRERKNLDQLFDFLVARFLLAANETAPEIFDQLASIAFGALIADAVAGIAAPGVLRMPDPPLRVVVDGPLLLDALDLSTPAHFEYANGLFDMMSRAKFRLVTFDHVLDEVRESIRSTLRAHGAGVGFGPLGDKLRSTPGLSVRAKYIADTVDERVKELGLEILRSELYERADFKKYFDDHSVDAVRNAIGDIHYQLERRIRDTNSVAAVVRLKRENRHPSSVFEAGTIFITRNSALVKQVNRALAIGRAEPDPRFTIVTDGQLASTLWFSLGSVSDFAAFSRKRLIANCSSAIVSQREVIQRIASMLESVDDKLKAEFETMMHDKRASLCVMRVTDGYVEAIDENRSLTLLNEMRRELAAPLIEPALAELSAKREELASLQQQIYNSRQSNVELQDVIDSNEIAFNAEQAQMSVLLEGERATKDRMKRDLDGRIKACQYDMDGLQTKLSRRDTIVKRVLIVFWATSCIIALLLSVFPEIISGERVRIIVFLILLSSLGFFGKWIDKQIDRCVRLFSSRLRTRMQNIQTTKTQYEQLLTQLGPIDCEI